MLQFSKRNTEHDDLYKRSGNAVKESHKNNEFIANDESYQEEDEVKIP